MSDFRKSFLESWLDEVTRLKTANTYLTLLTNINGYVSSGFQPTKLAGQLRKIELNSLAYYWYVDQNEMPIVIVEVSKKPQTVMINAVGKRDRGKPPWTTDLYLDILSDQKSQNQGNIRLSSDKLISDEGFAIWERLFNQGHKLSFYDNTAPGQTHQPIQSIAQLKSMFGDDKSLEKYQFVITESSQWGDTIGLFFLRRTLELTGRLDVDDHRFD